MTQTFAERRWSSSDGLSLFARDYAAASGTAKLPVIAIHGLTRMLSAPAAFPYP